MAEKSTIEWTNSTWNPVTGCDKVSAGCANCYAERFAERFRGVPGHPFKQGFDLKLWPSRLVLPLSWKEPKVIFVNSMSDLFHEAIPAEFIRNVFKIMKEAHWHTFQILTKRSERLAKLSPRLPWAPNIWMGVSVETGRFSYRIDHLRKTGSLVKFLSLEPLLGPLPSLNLKDIDWVIVGGESGPKPAGSHKLNTSVAQAYYNKKEGITKLTTETGAGQWGCALSLACQMFSMECLVYMVKVSYFQKPYRRSMIRLWGAEVIPSPSDTTASGRQFSRWIPDSPGSLGIAISEAVEVAAQSDDTHYSLGSVLSHVLLHQTVIGQEALEQMELAGAYPDAVIGCVGGGSNFAGIAFPFLGENLKKGKKTRLIAVEPAACPSMTKGCYAYDYGDTAKLTPLVKMDTLGHDFIPAGIHAGGLRYHGMAPLVSHVYDLGLIEAQSVLQIDVFLRHQLLPVRGHHPGSGKLSRHSGR